MSLHFSLHDAGRLVIHTHAQFTLLHTGMENAAWLWQWEPALFVRGFGHRLLLVGSRRCR